ncbi:hypothetical protein F5B22DRAFT_456441 [Xylaria bambusicola]|uniref:uncharacterized protein n=1 Tax=Xylaria bambusicola TaxID=326684 RepID=UPI0020073388|nr:uncharacterized protein F5B22DRAFT_456441 [Xylaria bambusicola]KAI0506334.1 hypothetical protein F5B22DRAFT_456441 [Xylaria bambusicola]
MAPRSMTRRAHYKSRKGCRQCKQRHVKCDEQRPGCFQCSMTARSCSFVTVSSTNGDVPEHISPLASSIDPPPKLSPVAPSYASSPASSQNPGVQEVPQQIFNLNHLALLHHVEHNLLQEDFVVGKENSHQLSRLIVTSALTAPYLMDAVLAFAALHLSVLALHPAKQHHYRHQAVQLQTRALALYNATRPEITEDNCTSLLLYSSFIGMHMLHDTATSRADLPELLDKFIQFAGLYRGVGIVTSHTWHILRRKSELRVILDLVEAADMVEPPPENICDHLSGLLTMGVDRLRPASSQACHDAVQALRWIFDQRAVVPAPIGRDLVLAWPVRISTEYLQLLRERLPEALVIMAYWAVLLHQERDFWVFGEGGRFLIEAISKYLGDYWAKWMAIPKQLIDANSIPKT